MADNDLRVGNKAKNLMALEAKGFKIPKTIYLSHEDCEEISNLMLQSENIKSVIETLETNAFFSFEKDLSYPIMVRSSSENEDSKEQSNAGKFLSIYNSHHRVDLIKNIVKVWATKDQAHKMGIVLQQQLSPLYSGGDEYHYFQLKNNQLQRTKMVNWLRSINGSFSEVQFFYEADTVFAKLTTTQLKDSIGRIDSILTEYHVFSGNTTERTLTRLFYYNHDTLVHTQLTRFWNQPAAVWENNSKIEYFYTPER